MSAKTKYAAAKRNGDGEKLWSGYKHSPPDIDPSPEVPLTKLVMRCAADIQPKDLKWFWYERLPLGMLCGLVGPPGVGKTSLAVDLTARNSRGDVFPGCPPGSGQKGRTIILSAEDDAEHVLVPRLLAAEADMKMVDIVDCVETFDDDGRALELNVALDRHIPLLEDVLESKPDTSFIWIDPVMAFLGARNSNRDDEVRQILTPLAKLAARFGVCILTLSHLNKSTQGPAMNRVMGSMAFVAASRAVWGCFPDHETKARVLFLPIKTNLGPPQSGLAYNIVSVGKSSRIEWEHGAVETTADEAGEHDKDATKLGKCQQWLRDKLSEGRQPSKPLWKDCRAAGFTYATFERAKDKLGCEYERGTGADRGWYTMLPAGTFNDALHELVELHDPDFESDGGSF